MQSFSMPSSHLPVHCKRAIVCEPSQELRQGCHVGVFYHKELIHVYKSHPLMLSPACELSTVQHIVLKQHKPVPCDERKLSRHPRCLNA